MVELLRDVVLVMGKGVLLLLVLLLGLLLVLLMVLLLGLVMGKMVGLLGGVEGDSGGCCGGGGGGGGVGGGDGRRTATVLVVGETAKTVLDLVGRVLADEGVARGGGGAKHARLRAVVAEHALGADAGRVDVLPELAHQRLGAAALAGGADDGTATVGGAARSRRRGRA